MLNEKNVVKILVLGFKKLESILLTSSHENQQTLILLQDTNYRIIKGFLLKKKPESDYAINLRPEYYRSPASAHLRKGECSVDHFELCAYIPWIVWSVETITNSCAKEVLNKENVAKIFGFRPQNTGIYA